MIDGSQREVRGFYGPFAPTVIDRSYKPSSISPMPTAIPHSSPFPWRALLLVLGIGVFYVATLREGHVWGDDHAAYLSHTRNIVEGRPYGDIGYLRSPTSINPLMYPPVFPLLLAPLYYFFGPDLTPMKIECTVFFCLALFFLYLLLREYGDGIAMSTVAMVGLCPYFWDFKDSLFSDFPFLAFAFAALWLAGKSPALRGSMRQQILFGALVGLLVGIAFGARTVGVVLAPVIMLFDCWKARRITTFAVTVGVVSSAIALGQNLAFHVKSDYLTPYLRILSLHSLASSPLYYLKCFSVVWENGYSIAFEWLLYGLAAALALKGIWTRIRADISLLELYFIAYFLFICLFPWGGKRYLMTILPFYFFYVLVGLRSFAIAKPLALRVSLYGGSALLVSLCYLARYSKDDWNQIAGGEQSKDATEMVTFLKSADVKSGPVVFMKARWLAFQSRLPSADIYQATYLEQITQYYARNGATWFVVSRIFHNQPEAELAFWVERSGNRFANRFENDSFTVYEMQ